MVPPQSPDEAYQDLRPPKRWLLFQPHKDSLDCAMLSAGTTTQSWAVTWTTAASLLAAQLYPNQRTAYLSVHAELVCWAIVFVVFDLASRYHITIWEDDDNRSEMPSDLLWVAPASIAVAALSSSAGDTTWVTVRTEGAMA